MTFATTKQLLVALPPTEILFVRFALGYAALWALAPRRLGWLGWPAGFGPALPDGLLEAAQTTKALPPDERRGELCSSNVSNQS